MKNLISTLLCCVLVVSVFTACSKVDDETISKDRLIGTWEGTAACFNGTWVDLTNEPFSSRLGFSITFYKNGTYYGRGAFGTGSGAYRVNGMTIDTYVDGDLYLSYKIKVMTETTAEITIVEGTETLDVRVRRASWQ